MEPFPLVKKKRQTRHAYATQRYLNDIKDWLIKYPSPQAQSVPGVPLRPDYYDSKYFQTLDESSEESDVELFPYERSRAIARTPKKLPPPEVPAVQQTTIIQPPQSLRESPPQLAPEVFRRPILPESPVRRASSNRLSRVTQVTSEAPIPAPSTSNCAVDVSIASTTNSDPVPALTKGKRKKAEKKLTDKQLLSKYTSIPAMATYFMAQEKQIAGPFNALVVLFVSKLNSITPYIFERMRVVVKMGGSLSASLNPGVTHIICCHTSAENSNYVEREPSKMYELLRVTSAEIPTFHAGGVHIVTMSWLIESTRRKRPETYSAYDPYCYFSTLQDDVNPATVAGSSRLPAPPRERSPERPGPQPVQKRKPMESPVSNEMEMSIASSFNSKRDLIPANRESLPPRKQSTSSRSTQFKQVSASADQPVRTDEVMIFEGLEDVVGLARLRLDLLDDEGRDHIEQTHSEEGGRKPIADTTDPGAETDEEEEEPDPIPKKRKVGGWACATAHEAQDKAQRKGPNSKTADALRQLADYYDSARTNQNDTFRVLGFRKAANKLDQEERFIDTYSKAIALPFVGDSIAKRIMEIVRSGTVERLDRVSEQEKLKTALRGIYGVGSNIATEWMSLGVSSVDDVRYRAEQFNIHLTEGQKLGLSYYDDLNERIPRDEIGRLYKAIKAVSDRVLPASAKLWGPMGSYRRGQPNSGDIDLMLTKDDSDGIPGHGLVMRLVDALLKDGILKHQLSGPNDPMSLDAKWMGICALPGGKMRRIDILGVPYDELGAALIYFTGNDIYNRSLRLKARKMGYSLNQRGLFKDVLRQRGGEKVTEGTCIASKTEQEIFDILKVPYLLPHQRMP